MPQWSVAAGQRQHPESESACTLFQIRLTVRRPELRRGLVHRRLQQHEAFLRSHRLLLQTGQVLDILRFRFLEGSDAPLRHLGFLLQLVLLCRVGLPTRFEAADAFQRLVSQQV